MHLRFMVRRMRIPRRPPKECHAMTDDYPIYCSAQTYRATRFEPAEHCETEVETEGDLCADHDAEDRSDADYENYLESLRKE